MSCSRDAMGIRAYEVCLDQNFRAHPQHFSDSFLSRVDKVYWRSLGFMTSLDFQRRYYFAL